MSLVSIIIPVYNEEKDIQECLNSLRKQSFGDFEIIVVDDGSTDRTLEFVRIFKGIKIVTGNHKGPGHSRNLGAKIARGKILVFVDADMTFDKDYLRNLINPILKKKYLIGTTHDYEIVKNTSNIWSRCWGTVRVSKEEANEVKIFRAIRKNKFIEMGGFDPKYGYADDQTFWFKYKIKPEVANNTTCYHKNPETLISVYKQSKWIGASIDNQFTKMPIRYFLPLILFIIFPFAIPLLSIKKCNQNKSFEIIIQMLIFMSFRYFGTIAGLARMIYFKKNYK